MYSKGGGGIVLAQSMPDESPDKFEISGLTPIIEQAKFESRFINSVNNPT